MLNCREIAGWWVGTRLWAYARVSDQSGYRMVTHKSLKSVFRVKFQIVKHCRGRCLDCVLLCNDDTVHEGELDGMLHEGGKYTCKLMYVIIWVNV